jgi:hypothetical protein
MNIPFLGKLSILKTYALSKLSFHMFLEPLSASVANQLNNITKWFLWSNEETPNKTKNYKSKMSIARLILPRSKGGLGLWNWNHRSDAFLVRLNSWMHKNNSKELARHWASSTSALAMKCKSIYPRPIPPEFKIKDILMIIHPLPESIQLTAGQLLFQTQFNVNFKKVWSTINSLPVACKVRTVAWSIYSKTLPLFHADKINKPELESTMGIFFGEVAQKLSKEISNLSIQFQGHDTNWTPQNILPLNPTTPLSITFSVCIFWALWSWRNKSKHSHVPTTLEFMRTAHKELIAALNLMAPDFRDNCPNCL